MPSCKACDNKECFISKYCSSEWYSLIDEQRTCTFYKKNDQILYQGNLATGIFFIYSGKAKVFNSINSNRQIIRLSKSGDILGHSGYGGCDLTYSKSAIALEDSIICFIKKETFFEALKANHELTFNMMMFYAGKLRKIEKRLNNMAKMNTKEKVADALLFIRESFDTVDFELKRQEISDIAGTTSEQVIRILSGFAHEKLIIKKGKRIKILNEQRLKEIVYERHFVQ